MNREEYSAEKARLEKAINNLKYQSHTLTKDYIREHQEFEADQKVRVVDVEGKDEIVFVRAIGTHDNGVIFYNFNESKKNGDRSKFRAGFDIIKSITPINK